MTRRLFILQSVLAVLLLLLVAVFAHGVLGNHLRLKFNLGGRDITDLRPETLTFLQAGDSGISLDYFVSDRSQMPSAMRGVEEAVRSLLQAFKEAAPERVDYRVIDPDVDPNYAVGLASGRGASPVKVRRVKQDADAEESVWSSLSIAHGQHRPSLVQGISTGDLPYLEGLLLAHLQAGAAPEPPVVGIATPKAGYRVLPQIIQQATGAKIKVLDLAADPHIPEDVDVLFWVRPETVGDAHRNELKRFVDSGRTVVLAGSTYAVKKAIHPSGKSAEKPFEISPSFRGWSAMLRPFGLDLLPRMLMEPSPEPISWRMPGGVVAELGARFYLRVPPAQFNTTGFFGPNSGVLQIGDASPILLDPAILAAADLQAQVIATTSAENSLWDLPYGRFADPDANVEAEQGESVGKQPWMVRVSSQDPWKGELLLIASNLFLYDDFLFPAGEVANANQLFLRTLLRTYTDPNRLVRSKVHRSGLEPLPSMTPAARLFWRGFTIFLGPVLFLLLAIRLMLQGPSRKASGSRFIRLGLPVAVMFSLLTLLWMGQPAMSSGFVDLTATKINQPSPLTGQLLDEHRQDLQVEFFCSEKSRLPSAQKRVEAQVRQGLRSLDLQHKILRPEDMKQAERIALQKQGIWPFELDRVQDDAPVPVKIWSSMRLRLGDRMTVIPRLDDRSIGHLEFLLVSAVHRLASGKIPRVGVLADLPRLTPGEKYTIEQKHQTAPVGHDVYSFTKKMLGQYGYDVVYINPDKPEFPAEMDLLLWLQPRYADRAYPQFGDFMAKGGKAIVAVQNYNVQQRQYRGTGFPTVYWPQPQMADFNVYLEHVGLNIMGEMGGAEGAEILFDINQGSRVMTTQVKRSAYKELSKQQVARPFLIRAVGEGLSADSPLTAHLGELLFIWGNRFVLDQEKLQGLGMQVQPLVSTSDQAWTYHWTGGWIPEEYLEGPVESSLGVRSPMALQVAGQFPFMQMLSNERGRAYLELLAEQPKGRPGSLLLIGCSEMFKNDHLYDAKYPHHQFLLNAVASLAHGPDMAKVQARQRKAKSFPYQSPERKTSLRFLAIGLGPICFLLVAFLRLFWRRRPVL